MKEKPVDKDLSPHVKSSLWVARHYKQILFFSMGLSFLVFLLALAGILYMSYTVSVQSRVINNMANKVVFVRTDGSVGILEKQSITAPAMQMYLKNFVLFYLLLSGFDFDYYSDITKNPKYQTVVAHLDQPGVAGYRAYVERVYMAYKNNNLPEYIWLTDMESAAEDFRYQDGKFFYSINMPVEIRYVHAERWNLGKGTVDILMRGYQSPARSSPLNPLGIMITQMEVRRYVGKGSGDLFGR